MRNWILSDIADFLWHVTGLSPGDESENDHDKRDDGENDHDKRDEDDIDGGNVDQRVDED